MQNQQLPDHDIIIKSREGFIIRKDQMDILLKKISEFHFESGIHKPVLITGFLIDPGPIQSIWDSDGGGLTVFANVLRSDSPPECDHQWTYHQTTGSDYQVCKKCGKSVKITV